MSSSSALTTGTSNGTTKKKKFKCHKEEETIELPKALDYLFEKELINKQNQHIHIMDSFRPSRNVHYLTSKFYARHEQDIPDNLFQYMAFIKGTAAKHDTEANVYGWMPESVYKPDILKQLNFINAPKQRCSLTMHGEKLEKDKANARPAFNGLRFFLK